MKKRGTELFSTPEELENIVELSLDDALEIALENTNISGVLEAAWYEQLLDKLDEVEQGAFTMGLATQGIQVEEMKNDVIDQVKVHFITLADQNGCIYESDYRDVCGKINDSRLIGEINTWLVSAGIPMRKEKSEYQKKVETISKHPDTSKLKSYPKKPPQKKPTPKTKVAHALTAQELPFGAIVSYNGELYEIVQRDRYGKEAIQNINTGDILETELATDPLFEGCESLGLNASLKASLKDDPSKDMPEVKKDMPKNKLNKVIRTLRDWEDEFLPAWKKFDPKKKYADAVWYEEDRDNALFILRRSGTNEFLKEIDAWRLPPRMWKYTFTPDANIARVFSTLDRAIEVGDIIEKFEGYQMSVEPAEAFREVVATRKYAQRIDEEKRKLEDAINVREPQLPSDQKETWINAVRNAFDFTELQNIWQQLFGTMEQPIQQPVEQRWQDVEPAEYGMLSLSRKAQYLLDEKDKLADLIRSAQIPLEEKNALIDQTYRAESLTSLHSIQAVVESYLDYPRQKRLQIGSEKQTKFTFSGATFSDKKSEVEDFINASPMTTEEKDFWFKQIQTVRGLEELQLIVRYLYALEPFMGQHSQATAKEDAKLKRKIKFDNNVVFGVDVAETPMQKAKGLEVKNSLDEKSGMLFPFEEPDHVTFHMGKVKFPIDILFLMEDMFNGLRVAKVIHNAQPGTYDTWSHENTKHVLELAGGVCEDTDIKIGSTCRIINRIEV